MDIVFGMGQVVRNSRAMYFRLPPACKGAVTSTRLVPVRVKVERGRISSIEVVKRRVKKAMP